MARADVKRAREDEELSFHTKLKRMRLEPPPQVAWAHLEPPQQVTGARLEPPPQVAGARLSHDECRDLIERMAHELLRQSRAEFRQLFAEVIRQELAPVVARLDRLEQYIMDSSRPANLSVEARNMYR